jgi:hypothetical protein
MKARRMTKTTAKISPSFIYLSTTRTISRRLSPEERLAVRNAPTKDDRESSRAASTCGFPPSTVRRVLNSVTLIVR